LLGLEPLLVRQQLRLQRFRTRAGGCHVTHPRHEFAEVVRLRQLHHQRLRLGVHDPGDGADFQALDDDPALGDRDVDLELLHLLLQRRDPAVHVRDLGVQQVLLGSVLVERLLQPVLRGQRIRDGGVQLRLHLAQRPLPQLDAGKRRRRRRLDRV
jgi:hypothetical protein